MGHGHLVWELIFCCVAKIFRGTFVAHASVGRRRRSPSSLFFLAKAKMLAPAGILREPFYKIFKKEKAPAGIFSNPFYYIYKIVILFLHNFICFYIFIILYNFAFLCYLTFL